VLAGPAKIGKSFLCWNIAFSVAMGGIALSDIEVVNKRNVLYLALDDDESLLQSRHNMILQGETAPDNVLIVNSQNLIKFDTTGLRKIERIVDDNRIELMIVDTLAHVRPDLKSAKHKTAYDIDYQSLMPIHKFAHRKNMGIILVTHTRKNVDTDNPFNQIQGSTGIQAGCDTLFMLTRNKSQGSYTDLQITGRRLQSKDLTMELCQGGMWKVIGEPDDFVEESPEGNEVLSVLACTKGASLSPAEVAKKVGITVKACQMRLTRLAKSGQIIKVGHGKYIHVNYNVTRNTA
jgi:predicted ATP-dependent serine protease